MEMLLEVFYASGGSMAEEDLTRPGNKVRVSDRKRRRRCFVGILRPVGKQESRENKSRDKRGLLVVMAAITRE